MIDVNTAFEMCNNEGTKFSSIRGYQDQAFRLPHLLGGDNWIAINFLSS